MNSSEEKEIKIMKNNWKKDVFGLCGYVLLVIASGALASIGLTNVHPEDWFV